MLRVELALCRFFASVDDAGGGGGAGGGASRRVSAAAAANGRARCASWRADSRLACWPGPPPRWQKSSPAWRRSVVCLSTGAADGLEQGFWHQASRLPQDLGLGQQGAQKNVNIPRNSPFGNDGPNRRAAP